MDPRSSSGPPPAIELQVRVLDLETARAIPGRARRSFGRTALKAGLFIKSGKIMHQGEKYFIALLFMVTSIILKAEMQA